jgi:hypothetical protein
LKGSEEIDAYLPSLQPVHRRQRLHPGEDRREPSRHYGLALAPVCAVVAILVAVFVGFGPEAKGKAFGGPLIGANQM